MENKAQIAKQIEMTSWPAPCQINIDDLKHGSFLYENSFVVLNQEYPNNI